MNFYRLHSTKLGGKANAEKLKGFDLDLSKFDPRNTNNMELRKISNALEGLGIVDQSTGGWFGGANLEFNSLGNEINKYKKVDLIEYFDGHLEFYKRELSSGYSIVKDAQTSLYTAISVLQALKEYALEMRANSFTIYGDVAEGYPIAKAELPMMV